MHALERWDALVDTLAQVLRERGLYLVTAESCTGGLIAAACTSVAGSSDWFERGVVTYSNDAKTELLGVPAALITRHGAVSAEVARAMAEGALAHSSADLSLAVTGIAGPGGGTPDKPVGTVWLALARRGEPAQATLLQLHGSRAEVREQTVDRALQAALAALKIMSLLLATDFSPEALAQWADALRQALPGETVLTQRTPEQDAEVTVALVSNPASGALQGLPKLQFIQSMWAGADKLLRDDTIPSEVLLARMVDPGMSTAMAETVLWAVLSLHRDHFSYAAQQREGEWLALPQRRADEVRVAVLGLGEMGRTAALRLAANGYQVSGWSRREVTLPGIETFIRDAALPGLLGQADIVINLLPLTARTHSLFNATVFAQMKAGASFVNLARGQHVVDVDLLGALNRGHLHHAVLDVFQTEPLPAHHAFWTHPQVTMLPHAAAQTDLRSATRVAVANLQAWREGRSVTHLVNRARGY